MGKYAEQIAAISARVADREAMQKACYTDHVLARRQEAARRREDILWEQAGSEARALAALGPEGVEYLKSLKDEDFTPFDPISPDQGE